MNITRLSVLILTALFTAACQPKAAAPVAPTAPTPSANEAWTKYVDKFMDGYFAAQPPVGAYEGRHEFDGQLPDWSAEGFRKLTAFLHAQRDAASGFNDSSLNATQRFERDYVISRIDADLFWLEAAGSPFHNPAFYFDNGLDPSLYITRPYAPIEQRLRAFIVYAKAIPNANRQIRATLQMPLPKSFVAYGVAGFSGFTSFYRKDVPAAFAAVKDAALQKELKDALAPAAASMDEMVKWLKSGQGKTTEDFALGPERFAQMLKMTERVDTPLAQLKAAGQADLDRNVVALKDACAQYLPKGTVAECVKKVSGDKPAGSVVEEARKQLQDLRQFIVDKSIVSIPSDEEAHVEEAPPYKRQNSAYIEIPGPYDKGLPSIYYFSPPDPAWSQAEQRAFIPGKTDLLFTSVHEVWPGHFLQFLHSNRSPFKFGQVFVGYAFAEGWAHYSEEMMWESGYGNQAPDVHIGQLLNALLRNVRFMCAIGLHTEGMKVEECQRMFSEQAMSDPGNARQQASRGTYDPAYLNYTLGKLMIRKLRSDWLAKRGGAATLHDFHDAFLSYGGPPIPLVRAQMLPGDNASLF
jgi:hypothetical protein